MKPTESSEVERVTTRRDPRQDAGSGERFRQTCPVLVTTAVAWSNPPGWLMIQRRTASSSVSFHDTVGKRGLHHGFQSCHGESRLRHPALNALRVMQNRKARSLRVKSGLDRPACFRARLGETIKMANRPGDCRCEGMTPITISTIRPAVKAYLLAFDLAVNSVLCW